MLAMLSASMLWRPTRPRKVWTVHHQHSLTPCNARLPLSLDAGPQAAARIGVQGACQRSCAEQCQCAPSQFAWDLALSRCCLQQLAVAQTHLDASAVRNMIQNLYHSLQARSLQGQALWHRAHLSPALLLMP